MRRINWSQSPEWAVVMKGDTDTAIAIFSALRSGRLQYDALVAAASVSLPDEDRELLAAILAAHAKAETLRNDICHGIWGDVGDDNNTALWLHSKHYALFNVTALKRENSPSFRATDLHRQLEREMWVYTLQDLKDIQSEIEDANGAMFSFFTYLRRKTGDFRIGPSAAERYHQLCARPRIASELDLIRQGQQNKKKARP